MDSPSRTPLTDCYRVDDLMIDVGRQTVSRAGAEIPLPRLSFQLLVALAEAHPRMLTTEELIEQVWAPAVVNAETISQRVHLLRQSLGDDPQHARYIVGVRGRGYRLDAPVSKVPSSASQAGKLGDAVAHIPAHSEAGALRPLSLATELIAAGPPEKSIAVLPFVDMSEKRDQEYFSDGLSEELITLLTKIPDLYVPARTSSFYFKGKQPTIKEIAGALNVAHVLEGSVRKSGNTLRITAQLIRVDSGYHLWSRTYDRELKDVFRLQDDIAGSVVRSLKATLLAASPRKARSSVNLDAYTLLLQGRYLIGRGAEADVHQALQVLQRAVALDPSYAPAWAELSFTYEFFANNVDSTPGENLARFRTAAERALELDPASADAHAALARIKLLYDLDWRGAAAEYEAARRADPSTPRPDWINLYLGCIAGPSYEILIEEHSRHIDCDPLNATLYRRRAIAQYLAGQLEAAERDARRALELSPRIISGYRTLTEILIARRHLDTVLATAELEPPGPNRRMATASAYQALGQSAEADRALEDLIAQDSNNWAYQIAEVYALRGDIAAALNWLERAYRQRDSGLLVLKIDPKLVSIRSDPRYRALLSKLNFPE